MRILAHILIVALALMAAAYLVPGIEVANIYAALIAAVVLGLLNVFVRPVLIILTLPVTLLTLGLFILVINTLLFWFAASFIDGFAVSGFLPAFVGSLIVSFASALASRLHN